MRTHGRTYEFVGGEMELELLFRLVGLVWILDCMGVVDECGEMCVYTIWYT